MTKKLLDLSGKIDGLIPIFEGITRIADSLGIPFFVIGAAARDLILKHGYGIDSRRGTIDVDLAIQIEDWEKYDSLSEALLETGQFRKDKRPHRFVYKDKQLIDMVPFGLIQNEDGEITWPPENEKSLSVIGFDEAHENSLIVRLRAEPALEIKVAPLSGLVVLKLISWKDRGAGDDRDSKDLAFIIENYYGAGNEDRLYHESSKIMEELDYRINEAGARLLGHDIAALIKRETKKVIMEILEEETNENGQYKLITTMVSRSSSYDKDFDEYKTFLNELKKGIYEMP